ncbi:MAG TPA: SDR family NAD(P)-dependent oxidoreductase [Trebonia sp.]|jgi:NAD(P)-dependent dehydrogenase (short-subunit alcohol dehydrogenase family)
MTENKAGHTIVWTGGSNGIGRRAAAEVLRRDPDAHLLILVRGGRGPQLASDLARETGNSRVSTVPCDLASFGDIRAAVASIGRQADAGEIPPLRGYTGNAGVQSSARTADGFEMTFAVNVLANYLLLRLLLPRFEAPARLIVVGSDVHFADFRHNLGMVPRLHWSGTEAAATGATAGGGPADGSPDPGGPGAGSALSPRDRMRAYARSKLGVIYLVHALARRAPDGIDVYTYNPGAVPGTGLGREAPPTAQRLSGALIGALQLTPFAMDLDKAGVLLANAVIGPRPGPAGSYIDRGKAMRSSPASYDPGREDELWGTAARLCGLETESRDGSEAGSAG